VVVTSAYSHKALYSSFRETPVDAFLRKPYQMAELFDVIQRFMSA
jgi:hypothetical protein